MPPAAHLERRCEDGPGQDARQGCPRERQWEAVELASAAGEAGLPVSLC